MTVSIFFLKSEWDYTFGNSSSWDFIIEKAGPYMKQMCLIQATFAWQIWIHMVVLAHIGITFYQVTTFKENHHGNVIFSFRELCFAM